MAEQDESEQTHEPGTGVLALFGRQLKLFRVAARLERAEFGTMTGYSASTVAAYEQGRRTPPPAFIDQADELLKAGGLLKVCKDEVARGQYPAFFRDAARLEAEASELHLYAVQAVPGLLQTEDYTRALLNARRPLLDDATIEQRVAARLARQDIFSRWPAPLMGFVIEETVFRRPFGGRSVLQTQLEHLLQVGGMRNVEIQVMSTEREDNAGVDGPFTLITRKGAETVAYLEVQGRSILVSEREEARAIAARYGIMRAQALGPRESTTFIEKLLGEL
ncbi:helix-turn-helix transcriptional regulator [uncultured Streptomyces sp.]|uniref:helix-turn-helix domain-containing protein n=1 Tax=uncultured Streptomyces sp. TaxID=174707 RepID=UPI0026135FD9|nr:helix-turn-helix transcriptional regulator [uncultured Streptomyces sp.]